MVSVARNSHLQRSGIASVSPENGCDRPRRRLSGSLNHTADTPDRPSRGTPNDNIVDTEGAGDWTTAAIIWGIVRNGKPFVELNEEDIVPILIEAQRFASEKISYLGSKGNINIT